MPNVGDIAQEGAGGLLGLLSLLSAARSPGGLEGWMQSRMLAQTDPSLRPGLQHSPFGAGFYFLGGERVPVESPLAAGQMGPGAPTPGTFQTRLAPGGPGKFQAREVPGSGLWLVDQYGNPTMAVPERPKTQTFAGPGPIRRVGPEGDVEQLAGAVPPAPAPPKAAVPGTPAYFAQMNLLSHDQAMPLSVRHAAARQVKENQRFQADTAGKINAARGAQSQKNITKRASAQRIGNLDVALALLDEVDPALDRVLSNSLVKTLSKEQKLETVLASLKGDEDATLLLQLPSFRATFARAFGDVGRLSVQEEQNVQRAYPDPAVDTLASAKNKIKNLRRIMSTMKERLEKGDEMGAMSGVRTGLGLAPTPDADVQTTPGGNTYRVLP